jgi:hypothetical protein
MDISTLAALITEMSVIIGVIIWVVNKFKKSSDGIKCLLRSEMLQIYYRHRETGTIRQYELENFVMLYEAYKALGGNSFIDKIYGEVIGFDVLT